MKGRTTGELNAVGAITLANLRDFILKESLEEGTYVLLHPHDFDELALDHKNVMGDSLELPFEYLGLEVMVDDSGSVRRGRVGVRGLPNEFGKPEKWVPVKDFPSAKEESRFKTIFRCGWCGNVVGENGKLLSHSERKDQIAILEKYGNKVVAVNGSCCPHGHDGPSGPSWC